MSEHHDLSPSSLERLEYCSGSYQMCKLVDKSTIQESEFAKEGTLLHRLVQFWEKFKDDNDFTEQQKESTKKCIDILCSIAPLDKWQREVKVEIIGRDFEILNYGAIDAVYESEDFIYAWDWKFGHNIVKDVSENLQVWNYVVGLIQKYGKPVIFGIYQEPLNFRSECTFNDDIIERFFNKYYSIKSECEDISKMVLVPDAKYCSYCDAMGICPKSKSCLVNNELAKIEHTSELSPAVAYDYYSIWKIIEKIGKNLTNSIKFRIQKGEDMDGFGIRVKSGNKTINDPQGAFDMINDVISVDELMKCVNLKITDLEQIFVKNYIEKSTGKITKKGAKEEFYIRLENHIKRGKDSVSLVQLSKKN